MTRRRLPQRFFARDTRQVASELLGCTLARRLEHGVLRARIVETEAYHGHDDQASHARFGRTPRASIMFGPPGQIYVYLIYGMHHCLNLVTMPQGFPAAVLIRGIDQLRWRGSGPGPECAASLDPVIGPGRLTRALAIEVARHNGLKAYGPAATIWVEGPRAGKTEVRRTARVGVDYAGDSAQWPWRYQLV